MLYFFFFKQKTAYEMRISDWSSDVCSSSSDFRVFRLPWKTLHDRPIIGNKRIRVAGATTFHAAFDLHIGDAVDRIQHFQHGKAAPIAAIEDMVPLRSRHQRLQCQHMGTRQIRHMDIIANPGPIRRGIVSTKDRSEEHTSELQSLMRISYAVFC